MVGTYISDLLSLSKYTLYFAWYGLVQPGMAYHQYSSLGRIKVFSILSLIANKHCYYCYLIISTHRPFNSPLLKAPSSIPFLVHFVPQMEGTIFGLLIPRWPHWFIKVFILSFPSLPLYA